jgi:glutaredoxin
LCDDAKSLLIGHGLNPVEIDIDADPELIRRYGACVPVVAIDGKERFRGSVSPVLLKRLLQSHGRESGQKRAT